MGTVVACEALSLERLGKLVTIDFPWGSTRIAQCKIPIQSDSQPLNQSWIAA